MNDLQHRDVTANGIRIHCDTVPGLTRQLLIDGAGHFIQQERPRLVNEALAGFLDALSPWGR